MDKKVLFTPVFSLGAWRGRNPRSGRVRDGRRLSALRRILSVYTALVIALLLLAVPATAPAREAGGEPPLPVIGPASPFTLISQGGMPVALADFHGRVVALTFIYTACPDICPMMTQKMVDVQDALGAEFGAKIAFVSITLDPEHDT